jgi:hypothetical protein
MNYPSFCPYCGAPNGMCKEIMALWREKIELMMKGTKSLSTKAEIAFDERLDSR